MHTSVDDKNLDLGKCKELNMKFPGGSVGLGSGVVLSLQWHRFDPCPRKFHKPLAGPNHKKKKKKKKKKKIAQCTSAFC